MTEQKRTRTQLSKFLSFLLILCHLVVSYAQVVRFNSMEIANYLEWGAMGLSIPVMLTISCKLTNDKTQFIQLYFLLDNIVGALLGVYVGMVGMTILIDTTYLYTSNISQLTQFTSKNVLRAICEFIFAGTMRIIIAFALLRKCELVFWKINLILCSMAFLIAATNLIINGLGSQEIKQFFLVYTFGQFVFLMEIYNKFTDFDGTGQLQWHYQLVSEEDEKSQYSEKGKQIEIKPTDNQLSADQLYKVKQTLQVKELVK